MSQAKVLVGELRLTAAKYGSFPFGSSGSGAQRLIPMLLGAWRIHFYDDGLHIALATVAEADVLVCWNFKHIVRFDKIRLFNAVNLEYGYKPLQIYSPREVTTYGASED